LSDPTCRGLPASPRGPCRIGAGARAPTGFWGRGCGLVFNVEPNKYAGALLGGRLEAPLEMLLRLLDRGTLRAKTRMEATGW
jgi:hypothetical protein